MTMRTFALSFLLASAVLAAYGSTRIIPRNPKPPAEPSYDTATVIDIMARVTDVWEVSPYMPLEGLHLTVKSGADDYDVYVGPVEFVKMFGVRFSKGDKIEVIGSRVMSDSGDVVLAAEIRAYGITMTLRDKDGTPYWKDWGSRPTGK